MGIKTRQHYQKEILAKYKKEKGGELRGYLAAPTRSQIRDACVYLFHRRNEKNDEYILSRFFQFKNDDNKLLEIKNFGDGRFRSIENFLKEEVENTSIRNLNLISWLIDFKPRPYEEYSKFENSITEEALIDKPESEITDDFNDEEEKRKQEEEKRKQEEEKEKRKLEERRRRRRRMITISISVTFGLTLMILGVQKWPSYFPKNNTEGIGCMTWADSLYVPVSCDEGPLSKYGTQVKPLDKKELKNMRRVEVTAAYDFFTATGKPLIWYYKNEKDECEFFTAPGLHPVNGATLKKITPYIIQKYVPVHTNKKNSFVQ